MKIITINQEEGLEKQFLVDLVGEEAAEQIWGAHLGALEQRERALRGDFAISRAILSGGGRNETAIRALMDTEGILSAEKPDLAAAKAIRDLRREHGYLFRTAQGFPAAAPVISREDLADMTMEEYRRYRKGSL